MLDAWFHEAQRAEWRSSAGVKRSYGTAGIVSSDSGGWYFGCDFLDCPDQEHRASKY